MWPLLLTAAQVCSETLAPPTGRVQLPSSRPRFVPLPSEGPGHSGVGRGRSLMPSLPSLALLPGQGPHPTLEPCSWGSGMHWADLPMSAVYVGYCGGSPGPSALGEASLPLERLQEPPLVFQGQVWLWIQTALSEPSSPTISWGLWIPF